MDIAKDLQIMKQFDMSVHQKLAVFSATTLLKKGIVEYDKTLHDLGMMVPRSGGGRRLSVLESLMLKNIRGLDRSKIETGMKRRLGSFAKSFLP